MKDKPTDLQAALARVPSMESLQILEKLSYNCAVMPKQDKYRRIKLGNAKIKASIGDVQAAQDALAVMGWEKVQDETDGEVLVLPEAKTTTMAEVRDIQAAQKELERKERDLKRSASAASLRANDDQARIRSQLEADRLERSAAA